MPSLGKIVRKVAGLPEPTQSDQRKRPTPSGVPSQGGPASPANPWEVAGQKAAQTWKGSTPRPSSSSTPSSSGTPWVPHDEKSFAVFARRFGRGLVWAVLILAAITGLRSWFFPPETETPPPAPAKSGPTYPKEAAQAVAARFARAYLGWDEAKADEREQLLASVLASGTDPEMGWDGHGRQDVEAVQPGAVIPGKHHQARVRVDALVRPYSAGSGKGKKKTGPTAGDARWIGLDVPVVEVRGQVAVTGEPGLVGIPGKGPKAPDLPTQQTDAELSGATEGTVDRFFRAYAEGETDSITAPGAGVPGLPGGVEYKGLASWSADSGGTDEDRTGTAHVTWSTGGATVEQTYRVELTRVSSADGQRWQVADVRGGTL